MATTAGTTAGFVPYSSRGSGGQSGHSIVSLAIANTQTISIGDVLTFASGVCSVNNAAAALIVGVATSAITTTTATDADRVEVALALPGSLFIGTLVKAVATDEPDPIYADLTQGAAGKDIAEHADGFPVILNDANVNDTIYLIAFAREQFKGLEYVNGVAGTNNPRVVFQFNMGETIFEPTSA